MRRSNPLKMIKLAVCVMLVFLLPLSIKSHMRSTTAYLLSPFYLLSKPFLKESKKTFAYEKRIAELEVENFKLLSKIEDLTTLHQQYHALDDQELRVLQSREKNLERLLDIQLKAIVARPLFRSLDQYSQGIWINAGKREGVVNHSPVIVGQTAIGMVDFVDDKQSKVRLINDPKMSVAVRLVRVEEGEVTYLAKGFVQGSSGSRLRVEGLNYDFSDDYGPARNLRDGSVTHLLSDENPKMLAQKGDKVLTSGLDGVFPSGLLVGEVSYVYPLKEGDYTMRVDVTPDKNLETPFPLLFVLSTQVSSTEVVAN